MGDGTVTQRSAPTAVSGGLIFSAIGAGGSHACALTTAGAAHCWGLNLNGQLGDGTTTDRQVPTAVLGGITFGALAPANRSTCALDSSGAGYCWGFNFGASITTPQPTNDGRTYVSADMGGDHVCALLASGAAFCGGRSANGQLGDGTTTDQPVSVAVLGGNTYTAIAGGTAHTCGLTATGTLCWGANNAGQLGDGTTAQRLTPAPVLGPPASVTVNGETIRPPGPTVRSPSRPRCWSSMGRVIRCPECRWTSLLRVAAAVCRADRPSLTRRGSRRREAGSWDPAKVPTRCSRRWGLRSNRESHHLPRYGLDRRTGDHVDRCLTSTNWSTATNWNPAQVPTTAEDVVIPAGTPNSPAAHRERLGQVADGEQRCHARPERDQFPGSGQRLRGRFNHRNQRSRDR